MGIEDHEKRDILDDSPEQWNTRDSYKAVLVQEIIRKSVKAEEGPTSCAKYRVRARPRAGTSTLEPQSPTILKP